MKKISFWILVLMISSLYCRMPNLHAQEEEAEIESFFSYLKSGDREGVLSLLTEPLLSERRELLEDNPEYSGFLKETYRSASIKIKNTEEIGQDKRAVNVDIYFSDQEPPLETKFILKRENGSWKISEEIQDS